MGTLISRAYDKIIDLGPETLRLIDIVIADLSTLLQHALRLQELQVEMTKTSDYILQEYPRLYIVGAFYSAFYSLAGIFSLVFVYNLRKRRSIVLYFTLSRYRNATG